MNQESTISSSKNKVVFPLTLSQAVQYLAAQRTENIHELSNKEKNKNYNKTWQHLSVRLRLIFKKFPKTIRKETYTFYHDPDLMNSNGKILLHQMSDTRTDQFYKKLYYVYYSITMCYILHQDSPFSSQDFPVRWLRNKNIKDNLFSNFFEIFYKEMEKIEILTPLMPNDGETISVKTQESKIADLSHEDIIKIIDTIENLIIKTYDNIKKILITPQKIRWLLSGIQEYSTIGKYQLLFENLYQSDIEKKLRAHFGQYDDFCEWFDFLATNYHVARSNIENSSLGLNCLKIKTFPAVWDNISNTETEVSQLELKFFSYLLDNIPLRGNENITNQLSHKKWYVLPIKVRSKIVDYIIEMSNQPERLVRFTNPTDLKGETIKTTMLSELQDICFQIRYPHQYKAYNQLITLYSEMNYNQEIIFSDNLDNIIEKIAIICKSLKRARKDVERNNAI